MSARSHRPVRPPLGVRLLNRAGRLARGLGLRPVDLAPEKLLAAARKRTGLQNFGEPTFRQPLERLLASLEEEAELTLLGRMVARGDVLGLLENRLRLVDAFARNPEIAEAPIRRPIFVLGLPRTGTSILHELLALDPRNRVPMSWEVKYPFPPPERARYTTDPRIRRVEEELGRVDKLSPEFKKMHRMGAELPQECVAITSLAFASMIFDTQYRVPSYQAWLDAADMAPAYRLHRRFLQLLQWKCPGERWVLKSPGHLWALDALLDEYPDARIVQTHRDPVRVLSSVSSLITTLRGLASDAPDLQEIARHWTGLMADGLSRTMHVRESGRLSDDRVVDVRFAEFMKDPIGEISRIYRHFGDELDGAAAQAMRRFLDANPSDKHGAHTYTFADTGLDLAEERARFRAYQERFSVPTEAV